MIVTTKLGTLIPSYNFEGRHRIMSKVEQEDFIKSSTLAYGRQDVRNYIKSLLKTHYMNTEVKNFFKVLLDNTHLLDKIRIVWDGSWANCCLLIYSNSITVTSSGSYYKINPSYTRVELLQYFADNAETIILNCNLIENNKEDMNIDELF